MINPPEWVNGAFVWSLSLPDEPNALEAAEGAIAGFHNLTDGAVRQVVFLIGAIGVDEADPPCDGVWPYWLHLTYRVNYDWDYLTRFMSEMREKYRADISFHVNITDVGAGLRTTPELTAFFEKLRDNRCIFARPVGRDALPWFGLPYIPQQIPSDLEPDRMFAMVDYKRMWDSGIAPEMIDAFYAKLPYSPPLLKVDVLGIRAWCIYPGYPDGELGGSAATQRYGQRKIVEHIRSHGSEVATEAPEIMFETESTHCWSHGGLAANDYSRIGSGYGMGCMQDVRGGAGMHVYGNQSGYHLLCATRSGEANKSKGANEASELYDGIRERDVSVRGLVQGFYLTVIQELRAIGAGAARLPGGSGFERLDEEYGRARVDALTVVSPSGAVDEYAAHAARLCGSVELVDDKCAVGGKTVTGFDNKLFNGLEFTVRAASSGPHKLFLRYSSVGGAVLSATIGNAPTQELRLADTDGWSFYGDHYFEAILAAGDNVVRISHELIFAEWDDGTTARWDRNGFAARRGDVEFGSGFDRMWPDTWSGRSRLFFYSVEGVSRVWTLPEEWAKFESGTLFALTEDGRSNPVTVAIDGCRVSLSLAAKTPYAIVPSHGHK